MRINYQGGALLFIFLPNVSLRETLIETELHSHTVRTLTGRTSLHFDRDDQNVFPLKSDLKITHFYDHDRVFPFYASLMTCCISM